MSKIKYLSLFTACFFFAQVNTAQAFLCEFPAVANTNISNMLDDDYDRIEEMVDNLTEFMEDDFQTAEDEVIQRIDEFENNILTGLGEWWDTNDAKSIFGYSTGQVHALKTQQSAEIGRMIDADSFKQTRFLKQKKRSEQHYRMRFSRRVCQVASSNAEAVYTQALSSAIGRGLTYDGLIRNQNTSGEETGDGMLFSRDARWNDYSSIYCDTTINRGQAGCPVNGAARNLDINYPEIMWNNKLTYDLRSGGAGNYIYINALRDAVDQIVYYEAEPVIPLVDMNRSYGRNAMLEMRSRNARRQVVHHALSQMVASRASSSTTAGGIGVYANDYIRQIRQSSGVTNYTDLNPGYREYTEAMFKDRFRDINQWDEIDSPSSVLKTRIDGKAVQLQLMHDFYNRVEDMMMLVAVDVVTDLDAAGDPMDVALQGMTVQ